MQRSIRSGIFVNHRLLNSPFVVQSLQFCKGPPKAPKDSKDSNKKKPTGDKLKSVEELKKAVGAAESIGDLKKAIGKPEDVAALKEAGAKPEDIVSLLTAGTGKPKGPTGPPPPPKIELRIVPPTYPTTSYDERNMKLGRKLSPHLSIYKKQLTSMLSIFIRISGCVLAAGVWAIGLCGLLTDMNIDAMVEQVQKSDSLKTLLQVMKICIALPFAYHVVGGTRHLLWYLNIFLSKKMVYMTGYISIVLSLLLAGVLFMLKPEEKKEIMQNIEYHTQSGLMLQDVAMGENQGIMQQQD